jgi:hypothetical protein
MEVLQPHRLLCLPVLWLALFQLTWRHTQASTGAVGAPAGSGAGPRPARDQRWLSFYGYSFNRAFLDTVNLAAPGSGEQADRFAALGVPSLLEMPRAGVLLPSKGDNGGTGLADGWEAALAKFAAHEVRPRLARNHTIGVFIGDEICCHNSTCWHDQLYPISSRLRALLGAESPFAEPCRTLLRILVRGPDVWIDLPRDFPIRTPQVRARGHTMTRERRRRGHPVGE